MRDAGGTRGELLLSYPFKIGRALPISFDNILSANDAMIEPPRPVDEIARLSSLHALGILDTRAEERFDRITRMTQRLFDVEISLISLVDADRQWFKSKQGIAACETSRDISFCGHAILGDEILIVEDARADARFADNPLVTSEPHIRFYAGCPIHSPDGYLIGTLCLIDRKPRCLSDEDQHTLVDCAKLVENEILLSTQATVDELTQVANRRGFNLVARHVLPLCQRNQTRVELAFFDLDGFKEVNDKFGHAYGDDMLKLFARLLTECFRSADVVARIGGDEFVVLMLGSDPKSDAALRRLENRAAAENSEIAGRLAWSAGRVEFDSERHSTIEAMLAEADSRMYRSKLRRRLTGS